MQTKTIAFSGVSGLASVLSGWVDRLRPKGQSVAGSRADRIPLGVGSSLVTHEEVQPGKNARMHAAALRRINTDLGYAMDHVAMANARLMELHRDLIAEGREVEAEYLADHGLASVFEAVTELASLNINSPLPKPRERARTYLRAQEQ